MTSFGWKRKAGAGVVRTAAEAFEDEAKDEELDNEVTRGEVDWLTLAPKKRLMTLEDAKAKSHRLRNEGATLADAERYWEAINKWDEALLIMPQDSKMLEMKAQALMAVGEVFPAVQTAQQAVNADPTWWEARQTLGRAQLNMGEVKLAIRSFCKAVMLNPVDQALWEEDLKWACSVRDRARHPEPRTGRRDGERLNVSSSQSAKVMPDCNVNEELPEQLSSSGPLDSEDKDAAVVSDGDEDKDCEGTSTSSRKTIFTVPANYVHLRG